MNVQEHILKMEKHMDGNRPISIQWFREDVEAILKHLGALETGLKDILAHDPYQCNHAGDGLGCFHYAEMTARKALNGRGS